MTVRHDGRLWKVMWATSVDDDVVIAPCFYCFDRLDGRGYPPRGARPVAHAYASGGDRSRGRHFFEIDCPLRCPAHPSGFPDTKYAGVCVVVDHETAGSV